jgi:TRAP-type C4-dicarboxylate transport system substrate-binding protein
MRFLRTLAAASFVAAAVAGCSTGPVDKGGGSGGILTLSLASPESPGRPGSQQVDHFTDAVQSLSEGRIRIEVTWDVGNGEASWDQVTAQQVIDGDSDLGFIPARAWDTFGVTTLQALQAPFLVTSDAALDAVVSDPVAGDMLAGLEEIGVTGLGLFPEGLRHPASFAAPLLEPADFAGVGIRTPRSELAWEVLQALGARPLDVSGDEEEVLFDNGELGGAETSAAYLPSLPRPGVMTANLTPYAKANVLAANTERLAELTDDERDVLRQAVEDTLAHSIDTRTSDAEDLATLCDQGLEVVLATADQQSAMTVATRPVRDRLAADTTTGPFLARITAIVEAAGPPSPVTPCDAAAAPGAGALTAFDGVWRYEVTYQHGLDAGLPEDVAASEMGVQTVRMDGGTYRWDWRSARGEQTCDGTYTIEDDLVRFTDEPRCGAVWEARAAQSEDEITWTDVRSRLEEDPIDQTVRELLHSVPWQKVEDIPQAQALPEGTYRWEVSENDLLAAGVDSGTAYHNSGLMTFTLEDGRWLHHTDSAAAPPDCGGTYAVEGSRVTFTADEGPQCGGGDVVFSGRWASVNGGIAFSAIAPPGPFSDIVWGTPWRRIS